MADQDTSQADWDAVAAERDGAPIVTTKDPALETLQEEPKVEAAVVEAAAEEKTEATPGWSAEQQAQLDQLMRTFPQLVNELKETKGRVGALQSELAKRQAQPAADTPNSTQVAAAVKDPEKWASLKKDFREWGEGIEAFVDARVGALPKGGGLTSEDVERQVAAATAGLTQNFEKAIIGVKHSSWEETVKTDDFGNWLSAQKPEVQVLAQSPKGADAIRMLDLFEEHRKKPVSDVRETRRQTLAAAVTGKPGAAAPIKAFEDMSPKEQWDYLAKTRT